MSDYQMKIKQGPEKGKTIDIKTEALVLGSGEQADVVIPGPGVEPRHARIVFRGGKVHLADLNTQSGTFRNGQRLLAPVQVFPGDRIGLGPKVILILEGDDPKQAQPAEDNLVGSVGKAMNELADDLKLSAEDETESPA